MRYLLQKGDTFPVEIRMFKSSSSPLPVVFDFMLAALVLLCYVLVACGSWAEQCLLLLLM